MSERVSKIIFKTLLLALAISLACILIACNSETNVIPTFTSPNTVTTTPDSTDQTGTTVVPSPSIPDPTSVFPTDTEITDDMIKATLEEAISNKNINAIAECIKLRPQLRTEYKNEIDEVANLIADEYIVLSASSEYTSEKAIGYKYLSEFKEVVAAKFEKFIKEQLVKFSDGALSADTVELIIKRIYVFDSFKGELDNSIVILNQAKSHKEIFDIANKYFNEGKNEEALIELNKIGQGYFFDKAQEKIAEITADKKRIELLKRATARYDLLDYDGAIANLEAFLNVYKNDVQATALLEKYKAEFEEFKKNTELFSVSRIRHVFTHTLIAFPEIELNNRKDSLNEVDNLTVAEFKALLESFYASNYVLIDYHLMFEIKYDENGKEYLEMRKNIRVPKGKIPMVMSIDAVYDTSTKGRGMVDKVVIKDGKLAGYSKLKTGEEVYSFDNEIYPILNTFCEKHPDFSFNGAKCVVAPTGYCGLLGHQVQKYLDYKKKIINPPEERAKAIEEATAVVNLMKEQGYIFATHTYSHPSLKNQTYDGLKLELELWQEEIGSIVGPVDYYIYPYGDDGRETGNQNLNNLIHEFGFYIFNGCGAAVYNINGFPWDRSADVIYIDRFTLSGGTLRYYGADKKSWIKEWDLLLLDGTTPKEIYDHENRFIKYGS